MKLLAVDIGGTKVAVALVTRQGAILGKQQQPTDLAGPEAVADQVAAMAAALAQDEEGAEAVGVCVPAALAGPESDRVIWAPNLPGWQDGPSGVWRLAGRRGPFFLALDGRGGARGGWGGGAGRGYRTVASVIIGTGIGGGLVIDGRPWAGRDRLAGAVGWFPLAGPTGPDHWENLAAGPAIARRARYLLQMGHVSTLEPGGLTARAVFDAARQGDRLARQVVREAATSIGQGVSAIISLLNPEVVVLGGSVGQQGDLLLDTVREVAGRWAQPNSARDIPIVSSTLGEEAGLLGAAYAACLRL